MIKSAYNFVKAPEANKVMYPEWSEQASHDIPFADAESGEIDVELTAQTPVFVRAGQSRELKEKGELPAHIMFEGKPRYFLPGTSIKGMLRNVLEIMSRSKMNPELVDNERFSHRDLSRGSAYMNKYIPRKIKGGWLFLDNEHKWKIKEVDFFHIHHSEIKKAINIDFRNMFLNRDPTSEQRKAAWKYSKASDRIIKFRRSTKEDPIRRFAEYDATSNEEGHLVMTGQPGRRNELREPHTGKVHEFIFAKKDTSQQEYKVSENLQKDFLFIYSDHEPTDENGWKYWREKFYNNQAVPVFFQVANKEISHMGLAFMYKLPYEYSVHELDPIKSYDQNKQDYVQTIFGHSNKKTGSGPLKGRVMVGHAFSANAVLHEKALTVVLGSPKASFYPFYLEQNDHARMNTYDRQDVSLRGFKRYPVHKSFNMDKFRYADLKDKVSTTFRPIEPKAVFRTKIRFHNLRASEIGALLSAITFHGNQDTNFHSIGLGKPLGFGKIKVQITGSTLKREIMDYLGLFEKSLYDADRTQNWIESANINSLLTMSSGDADEQQELVYPILSMQEKINEFNKYKQDIAPKLQYNKLPDNRKPHSFLKEYLDRQKVEKQKLEEREEIRRIELMNQNSVSLLSSNDISAIESFINLHRDNPMRSELEIHLNHLRQENKNKKIKDLQNIRLHLDPAGFNKMKESLPNEIFKLKQFEFSPDQIILIKSTLKECFTRDKQTFFDRRGNAKKISDHPWTDISKWIGKADAENLHKELYGGR
jgi:CRISPR-associated protein (TIGR03986 family)